MTRISWGSFGSRRYETGVDRGVFYPSDGPGLPWNSLITVKEDPDGAAMTKQYVDGVPYWTQKTKEGFAAVLQAYTSPREFDEYDGHNGRQRRKPFGLSYRTLIGSDISADQGYKIHLVYNCLAMPTTVDNSTLTPGGLEATPFSWGLSTTPVPIPGAKPAAHLIIDSTIAYPEAIAAVEDALYGSDGGDPYLPSPQEVMDILEPFSVLLIVDHGDGTWSAIGPDEAIQMIDTDIFEITWPSAVYLDADTYTISSL